MTKRTRRPIESLAHMAEPAGREPGNWQLLALCADVDPESFFPDRGEPSAVAVRVCLRCPVRRECLAFALSNDERFGIWGGLTEDERRRMQTSPERGEGAA